MKNQYFGDINDYRKYGLLRAIATSGLSIGVCWLLTPDDGGRDGELRRYLADGSRWRRYDSELYDTLQRLREPDARRDVRYAEEWSVVPHAAYFDVVLTDRGDRRDRYFQEASEVCRGCDVVFFDPDNGVEVPSVGRGKRGSSRYVYWIEMQQAYSAGHSVLVYQHFPRSDRRRFISSLADRFRERLGAAFVEAFVTPYVGFFLARQLRHDGALLEAAQMVRSNWAGQIHVWEPNGIGT